MFELIEQMQELLKTYYICLRYDPARAAQILVTINDWRLTIAKDASLRQIFWAKVVVPAAIAGYQQSVWFTRDDSQFTLVRGLAQLDTTATVSAMNQGNRQRIFTREFINWKQIFAPAPLATNPNNVMFDYPQEILFAENESLGLTIQGQTDQGYIFHHGANLRDTLEQVDEQQLKDEIASYLPEPQLVPILFQFANAVTDDPAVNASGSKDIFSVKNDHTVILTHVCSSTVGCRVSLIDNARNQLLADNVDIMGFAGNVVNQFEVYRRLPYPHILRRGDRLKLTGLNHSEVAAATSAANNLNYLVFKGYTM